MQPAPRATRRFTADEVMRMVEAGILAEDEPVELLDGELVLVTPEGPPHAATTSLLTSRFIHAYGSGFVVREAKPMVADVDSLPEPDIAVFRGEYAEFFERHPRGDEAVLVIEAAKTSLVVDHAKAATYARAGVPVYWLLDLVANRLEVHTEPHTDGRYAVVRVLAGDDAVALPALGITWRVRDLLPPKSRPKRAGTRPGRPRAPRRR